MVEALTAAPEAKLIGPLTCSYDETASHITTEEVALMAFQEVLFCHVTKGTSV